MIHFEIPETQNSIVKIIGVGGGGSNAVSHMQENGTDGVDLIICNTDSQALANSPVATKIQLGPYITQGLGAGANPEVGEKAAEESIDELKRILETNTKMVFITAGMGGGTGTGGAPIIARICKDLDILTVAIVTTPFFFEGKKRMKHALAGIEKLKESVDTIIVISNDKLREQCGDLTFLEAFSKADGILSTAANCITSVIKKHDRVNTDFADVNTVMRNGGVAILGRATASGQDRAMVATEEALTSPLLNNNDIEGAKWLLVNISSSEAHAHTMDEMAIIENYLSEQAGEDCNVILGMGIDNDLGEELSVTLIATGFIEDSIEAPHTQQRRALQEKNKIVVSLEDDEEDNKIEDSHEEEVTMSITPDMETNNEQPTQTSEDNSQPSEPTMESLETTTDSEEDENNKIVLSLDDENPNALNVGEMIYGSSGIEHNNPDDNSSIQDKLSSQFDLDHKIDNEMDEEEIPESPNEKLYQQYGIPTKKGIKMLTEEERKELLDFEIQKLQLENRAQGLFSLKSDITPLSDNEEYMHDVPAIERMNKSSDAIESEDTELNKDEGYLSGYRVTDADIENNKLISSINNFLHGKKPD